LLDQGYQGQELGEALKRERLDTLKVYKASYQN
jgi:tRNA nucleotidyltransferase (CCA-adding enzyme)